MGLLKYVRTEKETKGTGTVPIFQFTTLGRLMAWVVESMDPDKREHAVNHIYDLFQNNYKEEPASSFDIFCSIYYRKCKERGLFEALVEHYRKAVGASIPRLGRRELSRRLMMIPKYDAENSRDFWTLWNDTLVELDENTRKCIFHHLKLEIERKAEEECHTFGTFEKIRLEAKNDDSLVTVEGRCMNCGLYTPCAFKLDGYMQMLYEVLPNGVIAVTCPACKKDGSLEFPILI